MQYLQGGPKPQNTLSNDAQASLGSARANRIDSSLPKSTWTRRTTTLCLKSSRGNNVPGPKSRLPQVNIESEPSSKRLKTGKAEPLGDDVYSIPDSTEDMDELASDGNNSKHANRPLYFNSQSPSLGQALRPLGPSPEFSKVEDMMNSKNYAKHAEGENNLNLLSKSLTRDFTIQVDPIEPTKRYQGTARPGTVPRAKRTMGRTRPDQRQTGETSRHFVNQNGNNVNNGQTISEETHAEGNHSVQRTLESNLRDQSRRGDPGNTSPDELTSGSFGGSYAKVSRIRSQDIQQARSQSSIQEQVEAETCLPKSTIPHSAFTVSKRKQPNSNRVKNRGKGSSPSNPPGFSMRSIRHGHTYIENDNMALVVNMDGDFDIIKEDQLICTIQKSKICRLQWETSGRRTRLEIRRSETEDSRYDIEFRTELDCVKFNNFCQCNSVGRARYVYRQMWYLLSVR